MRTPLQVPAHGPRLPGTGRGGGRQPGRRGTRGTWAACALRKPGARNRQKPPPKQQGEATGTPADFAQGQSWDRCPHGPAQGPLGNDITKTKFSARFPEKAPEVILGLNSNPSAAFFNLLCDLGRDASLDLTFPPLKWKEYKRLPVAVQAGVLLDTTTWHTPAGHQGSIIGGLGRQALFPQDRVMGLCRFISKHSVSPYWVTLRKLFLLPGPQYLHL